MWSLFPGDHTSHTILPLSNVPQCRLGLSYVLLIDVQPNDCQWRPQVHDASSAPDLDTGSYAQPSKPNAHRPTRPIVAIGWRWKWQRCRGAGEICTGRIGKDTSWSVCFFCVDIWIECPSVAESIFTPGKVASGSGSSIEDETLCEPSGSKYNIFTFQLSCNHEFPFFQPSTTGITQAVVYFWFTFCPSGTIRFYFLQITKNHMRPCYDHDTLPRLGPIACTWATAFYLFIDILGYLHSRAQICPVFFHVVFTDGSSSCLSVDLFFSCPLSRFSL